MPLNPEYARENASPADPVRDSRHGRTWRTLPAQRTEVQLLSSPAFLQWLKRPVRISRPGAASSVSGKHAAGNLLERGGEDKSGTWSERQLILDESDRWRFEGGAGYQPVLIDAASIPPEIHAALFNVADSIASASFGIRWSRRLRLISIQPTIAPPFVIRGDHVDQKQQGDFIGTYTAQGSGVVSIDYPPSETPPPEALARTGKRGLPQMRRVQDVGCFYSIYGESRVSPTEHSAAALEDGRISLTFRFVHI